MLWGSSLGVGSTFVGLVVKRGGIGMVYKQMENGDGNVKYQIARQLQLGHVFSRA